MNLPARIVKTWQDLQLNFEALAKVLGKLQFISFGTGSVTWPGGSPFASGSVNHTLSRTPAVALVCDGGGGTMVTNIPVFSTQALGTATVSVAAMTSDASLPAAGLIRTFYWIALG